MHVENGKLKSLAEKIKENLREAGHKKGRSFRRRQP